MKNGHWLDFARIRSTGELCVLAAQSAEPATFVVVDVEDKETGRIRTETRCWDDLDAIYEGDPI